MSERANHYDGAEPLLDVAELSVEFRRRHLFGADMVVQAVRGATFSVGRSETFALVGESGSGKSTTARAVLRLVPSTGSIMLDGHDLQAAKRRELRRLRPRAQMIFQDPYSSLDPAQTVVEIIAEPLRTHTPLTRRQREDRAVELLDQVGLGRHHLHRYPHEFSGGQRQRIAIARSIALNPSLVICDEAVSALDVSTQNQVINLLEDLRESHHAAYLFITHNLAAVRHIAQRVGVMYLGRIVETATMTRLFDAPAHPYTRALLAAMPVARPGGRDRTRTSTVRGELPDPANPPAGCAFHPRCPDVMEICRVDDPAGRPAPGGGEVRCHLYPPVSEVPVAAPQATSVSTGKSSTIDL